MLRSKEDVDRHTQQILRKLKTEVERKQKCFYFGQLYMKVKDFESVKSCMTAFLSLRPDSAPTHRYLGQACEELGELDKALASYENSLKYDPKQPNILLKVCELYLNKRVTFNPEKAQAVLDKCQPLFPHDPVLFALKEKLMGGTDEAASKEEFEKLLQDEVKSRPNDADLRAKLLRIYVKTNRVDVAFKNALEIENRKLFNDKLIWYECLDFVFENYKKEFPTKCDWEFYMHWLSALDRVCSLSTQEINTGMQTSEISTRAIFMLDKVLLSASQVKSNQEVYNDFINHISGQLVYHMAVELIKIAKKEVKDWNEAKKNVSALLLFATNWTAGLNSIASLMNLKESLKKCCSYAHHHAQARFCQAGYTLISFTKDAQGKKQFLDKINYFTAGQWRNQVYEKLFNNLGDRDSQKSHFVMSSLFKDIPQKIPSSTDLKPTLFVESFELSYNCSLHSLVWLGLNSISHANQSNIGNLQIVKGFQSCAFSNLNFTTSNLSNCGVESLNQLDVDSFLYCTILCAYSLLEEQKTNGIHPFDQPSILPSEVTALLVTDEQLKWWNAAVVVSNKVKSVVSSDKISQQRFILTRGLEVLRGERLSLPLIVSLARSFAARVEEEKDANRKEGCERRALYLWDLALLSLKVLSSKVSSQSLSDCYLFCYPSKVYSGSEINRLLEEGRYFIGCHYFRIRLLEKALDIFKLVNTPEAIFKQALIYEMMSNDVSGSLRGDEMTSELRSKEAVLASKSRDCLRRARDAVIASGSDGRDGNHPLLRQIADKMDELDALLSRIEPENGMAEGNGLNLSTESFSCGSGDSSPVNIRHHHTHNRSKQFPASTPKHGGSHFKDYGARNTSTADVAELLNVHQNTSNMKIQQITEQLRLVLDRLDNMFFEQRTHRTLFDDVLNKLCKLETGLGDMKKEIKKPDLYNMLDGDDFTEDMLHYPSVNPYFTPRPFQAAGGIAYGPPPMQQYFSPNQMYPGGFYGFPPPPPGPLGDGPLTELLRNIPPGTTTATTASLRPPGPSPMAACLPQQQQPVVSNVLGGFGLASPHLSKVVVPPQTQTSTPAVGPNNVVITTSDTLPTVIPTTTQPTLSVTIPPEHRLGGGPSQVHHPPPVPPPSAAAPVSIASLPTSSASITSLSTPETTAVHKFQIPMPSNFKLVEKSPVQDPSQDEIEADLDVSREAEVLAEHDPLPNYKPVIPLPDEVEVYTGEENEQVLYDNRAKLFRFVNREWKERGIGQLKILKNAETNQYRILMRRDQVHKVCANHFITDETNLVEFKSCDRAWIWWANDFADEKVTTEKLLAKFKTIEDSRHFKTIFDEVKEAMKKDSEIKTVKANSNNETQQPSSGAIVAALKTEFPSRTINVISGSPIAASPSNVLKPSMTSTPTEKTTLLGTPVFGGDSKDDGKNSKGGPIVVGGFTFTAPPKLFPEKDAKPNETKLKPNPFSNFSFGQAKSGETLFGQAKTSEFSFGQTDKSTGIGKPPSSSVNATKDSSEPIKGFSATTGKASDKDGGLLGKLIAAKTEPGSWECSTCYVSNSKEAVSCVSCGEPSKLAPLKKTVAPGSWTCSGCYVDNVADSTSCVACQTPSPHADKSTKTTTGISLPPPGSQTFSFGIPDNAKTFSAAGSTQNAKNSSIFSFGTPVGTTSSSSVPPVYHFGSMPASSTSTAPTIGSTKFSFTMPPITSTPSKTDSPVASTPTTTVKSPIIAPAGGYDDSDLAPEDDQHLKDVHFEPVVALPDKVEIRTGEEDEEVVYCHRAKLFRYDANPDQKVWKERGTGDVKILRHEVTRKLRLLMRREPVMMLSLNHYITPDIEMTQKDNKSWFWSAADFSDGEVNKVEEAVQKFSIRFKTPEIANEFKEAFEKAKKEVIEKGLHNKSMTPNSSSEKIVKSVKSDSPVVSPNESTASDDEVQVLSEAERSDVQNSSVASSDVTASPSPGVVNIKPPSFSTPSGGLFFGSAAPGSKPSTPAMKLPSSTIFSGTGTPKQSSNSIFGGTHGGTPSGDISSVQETPKAIENSLFSGTPKGYDTPIYYGSPNASFFGGTPNVSTFGTPKPDTPFASKLGTSVFSGGALFGNVTSTPSAEFSFGSVQPKPAEPKDKAQTDNTSTPVSSIQSTISSVTPTTVTSSAKPVAAAVPTKEPDFLNKGGELSFGSIASSNESTFKIGNDFKWEGAGASVFGSVSKKNEKVVDKSVSDSMDNSTSRLEKSQDEDDDEAGGGDDGDNCEEHDPVFEPIVPLPDKIELKTGEEDEDIVFTERCKLFRLDRVTKEWKERGIGNIKLLKHRVTNSYRLLMRREQVHKIVLNHLVKPELNITAMKNSEKSWCWVTMNLSQDITEPVKESLGVRFKSKELADSFKSAVETAKDELKSKSQETE